MIAAQIVLPDGPRAHRVCCKSLGRRPDPGPSGLKERGSESKKTFFRGAWFRASGAPAGTI